MNKFIEAALAKQVLEIIGQRGVNAKANAYILKNGEIEIEDSISGTEAIREIMKHGVSPITIFEHHSDPFTLIEHVFSNTQNTAYLELFIDSLTEEHIQQLGERIVKKLYNKLQVDNYNDITKKFIYRVFELGFDFKQGTFNEDLKAEQGDIDFFEACLIYKPNFDFSRKYNPGMYLDELLKEELESMGNYNNADERKRKENLYGVLYKARTILALKNQLDSDLPTQQTNEKKNKI